MQRVWIQDGKSDCPQEVVWKQDCWSHTFLRTNPFGVCSFLKSTKMHFCKNYKVESGNREK